MKQFVILSLLVIIISISGCTINPIANSTFGEKKPASVNDLSILNDTGAHDNYKGNEYYYIEGYLQNNYGEDAHNVKIQAKFYDKNSEIIAINESAYIDPQIVPGKGKSYFYLEASDPNKKIVRYEIKIVDVQ